MDLQLVGQALGLSRLEDLVQRARRVGIEVVHHQRDLLDLGIDVVDRFSDIGVGSGAPPRSRAGPPPFGGSYRVCPSRVMTAAMWRARTLAASASTRRPDRRD